MILNALLDIFKVFGVIVGGFATVGGFIAALAFPLIYIFAKDDRLDESRRATIQRYKTGHILVKTWQLYKWSTLVVTPLIIAALGLALVRWIT